MNKANTTLVLGLALLTLAAISSCVSLSPFSLGFSSGKPSDSARVAGTFRNNGTVYLEAGTYRGNLTIKENMVTVVGKGTGLTLIDGDVRIDGNSCTLRLLRVRGDLYLNGNNADIREIVVEGRVITKKKGKH